MLSNIDTKEILLKYFNQKDYYGLIEYCNSKIELDYSNYLLFGAKGKAYIELQEYDKAIVDISQALKLNIDYAFGFYNRGICYYETDKYELAIIDLEKAKTLNQDFDIIDFYLGDCYRIIDNHEKAIMYFSQHLLNYEDEVALNHRANLYYLTNQFEKAYDDITEIILTESSSVETFEEINNTKKSKTPDYTYINSQFKIEDIGFFVLQYENKSSGIYILEFNNKEYYIGQAKNIHGRIKQHFKKYNDITCVYVKPVIQERLFEEENFTISIFEKNKIRIRNLKQLEFNNIFDHVDQEKWTNNINYNVISGDKFNNNDIRKKSKDKFLQLREKPYYQLLIDLLSDYIEVAIPNYLASEYNYWSITCLPNYLKQSKCVSRININDVPVLSIFEEIDNSLTFMLYVSKLPYLRYVKQKNNLKLLFETMPSLQIELRNGFEEKTQGDEITLLINQNDFQHLLNHHLLISSIRLFNLRMIKNVGKEEKSRRSPYHCLDLADVVISKLANTSNFYKDNYI